MHITRIELEDIKSHREANFEFDRGTTAITGENGAGKTTIIEAVAWTLFDLLDYKKDDFVRRGAKKGSARVTFESGLDGREYSVYRDTGTGYNVYDPQLKMRIAEKKRRSRAFSLGASRRRSRDRSRSAFPPRDRRPAGNFHGHFPRNADRAQKSLR
jgi:DNA repair exonuclease SbcCD ATPase subunit